MTGHEYRKQVTFDGLCQVVRAGCSCGWWSAYAHASDRLAREDHQFHLITTEEFETVDA